MRSFVQEGRGCGIFGVEYTTHSRPNIVLTFFLTRTRKRGELKSLQSFNRNEKTLSFKIFSIAQVFNFFSVLFFRCSIYYIKAKQNSLYQGLIHGGGLSPPNILKGNKKAPRPPSLLYPGFSTSPRLISEYHWKAEKKYSKNSERQHDERETECFSLQFPVLTKLKVKIRTDKNLFFIVLNGKGQLLM